MPMGALLGIVGSITVALVSDFLIIPTVSNLWPGPDRFRLPLPTDMWVIAGEVVALAGLLASAACLSCKRWVSMWGLFVVALGWGAVHYSQTFSLLKRLGNIGCTDAFCADNISAAYSRVAHLGWLGTIPLLLFLCAAFLAWSPPPSFVALDAPEALR